MSPARRAIAAPQTTARGFKVIQKNWEELIKPNKLEINSGHDAQRFATVVAEPLERGFGLTLGNALRRVL
ncbi:MAG: DNA-directed RNA polymerase subunit alpha, partial [Alphaproteobacteria bacterium]|nr:DNA-directed RNA polymerase subunit alpha [Alphaproteobacteria bacterium]MDX5492436.1 DNA-directed RNA polymerase subunit alpha [Alphaproteobacteria bacterium]